MFFFGGTMATVNVLYFLFGAFFYAPSKFLTCYVFFRRVYAALRKGVRNCSAKLRPAFGRPQDGLGPAFGQPAASLRPACSQPAAGAHDFVAI